MRTLGVLALAASFMIHDLTLTQESAAPLMAEVVRGMRTSGFRVRATLTQTDMKTKARQVRQLVVTGRRDGSRATTLFQVAWPDKLTGDAVRIDDTGDHRLKGVRVEGGRTTTLTSANRSDAFMGSDLSLEDLAFSFWFWPTHLKAGAEAVGEYDCVIVDSRPPKAAQTAYSRVRTWVAPAVSVPLRIEVYSAGGAMAKRMGMYRILKLGERWLPAILTVEPAHGRTRTVIEGVKYESAVRLTDADFALPAKLPAPKF